MAAELEVVMLSSEGRLEAPAALRISLDFMIEQTNRNFKKLATLAGTGGMFALIQSDFTLGTGTDLQTCFPASSDVWTLAASTAYLIEGVYYIGKSGTTCTVGIGFTSGGGLSTGFFALEAYGHASAINATSTTVGATFFTSFTGVAVAPTNTTDAFISFRGVVTLTAGGTLTPGIIFSAAPTTPLMKAGSHIRFTPIGSNSVARCGNVA